MDERIRSSARWLPGLLSLALVIGLLTPSTAATAQSPVSESVPAMVEAPLWNQESARSGAAVAPLSVVRLGRGGTAAWAAVVTAGTEALEAGSSILFSNVPAGVSVKPGASVPGADGVVAQQCQPVAESVVCTLGSRIGAGQTVAVPVVLTAASRAVLGSGVSTVSVADAGGAVATDSSSAVALRVQVVKRGHNRVLLRSAGDDLTATGEAQTRQLVVFNLGGARMRRSSKVHVRLGNVLPSRLARSAKASGQGWRCPARRAGVPSCVWTGSDFGVGSATSPLTLFFGVPQQAYRGLPKDGPARELTWSVSVDSPEARIRQRQADSLFLKPREKASGSNTGKRARAIPGLIGDLTVTAQTMDTPQRGGVGKYQVMVSNGSSAKVRQAQVKIRPPARTRFAAVQWAKGWKCSSSGLCKRKGSGVVRAHSSPTPIIFTVRNKAGKPKRALRATATWRYRDRGRMKVGKDSDTARAKWNRPLRLTVADHPDVVFAHSSTPSRGVLNAQVDGLAPGGQYRFQWRQVCPRGSRPTTKARSRCPKVTWDSPPSGVSSSPEITAGFAVPQVVKKQRTLTFRLTVSWAGQKLRGSTRVPVVPQSVMKSQPRLKRSVRSARRALVPTFPRRVSHKNPGVTFTSRVATQVVAPRRVGVGQRVRLKAVTTVDGNARLRGKARVVRASWTDVDVDGTNILIGGRKRDRGRSVTFRAPAKPTTLAIAVHVRHRSGAVTSDQVLVRVLPRSSVKRGGSAALTATADSKAPAFCFLYEQASRRALSSIGLDGGQMIWVESSGTTGSGCQDRNASITFSRASTLIGGLSATDLEGTITLADGLDIKSGVLLLPGSGGLPGEVTRIRLKSDSIGLAARWGEGALGRMGGRMSVAQIPYLPLPDGWTARGHITFTPGTNVADSEVNVDIWAGSQQSAGSRDAGAIMQGSLRGNGAFRLDVTIANIWPITGANGSVAYFGGGGFVSYDPTKPEGGRLDYQVRAEMRTQNQSFPIYGGINLGALAVEWNPKGFDAAGTAFLALGGTVQEDSKSQADAAGSRCLGRPTVPGCEKRIDLRGHITDFDNWSLTVSTDYTYDATYVDIQPARGTLSESTVYRTQPDRPDGPPLPTTKLSLDIKVKVASWKKLPAELDLSVDKTTVFIGIFCDNHRAIDSSDCAKKTLQVQADIQGKLNLPQFWGGDIDINSTVRMDPLTYNFTADLALQGDNPSFGPKFLHTSGMKFFFTTQPSMEPSLAGSYCLTPELKDAKVIGVTGQYNIGSGVRGTFSAVITIKPSFNYCVQLSAIKADDLDDVLPGGQSWKFDQNATAVFSSKQQEVFIDNTPNHIDGGTLTAFAYFRLPSNLSATLGGKLDSIAVQVGIKPSKFAGDPPVPWDKPPTPNPPAAKPANPGREEVVDFDQNPQVDQPGESAPPGGLPGGQPTQPSKDGKVEKPKGKWIDTVQISAFFGVRDAYLFGSAADTSRPSLQVTRFGLSMIFQQDRYGFQFETTGQLRTPGSGGGTTPDGAVAPLPLPITGTLGVWLARDGGGARSPWSIEASLRAGTESGEQMFPNAFGVAGLNVYRIAIMGQFSPTPGDTFLGIAADVETGEANSGGFTDVMKRIGIQPKTRIRLAFQVAPGTPNFCAALSVGEPTQKDPAINWGGVVKASYVRMVWSPMGCKVAGPNSPLNIRGFAFDFKGTILGETVLIQGKIEKATDGTFSGDLLIDVPAFNLGGLGIRQTKLELTFDAAKEPKYPTRLAFQGGLNAWGAVKIDVEGEMEVAPTWGEAVQGSLGRKMPIKFKLKGSLSGDLVQVFPFSGSADLEVDAFVGLGADYVIEFKTLRLMAQGDIRVLFLSAGGGVDLNYSNGRIQSANATLRAGFNLYLVKGEAVAKIGLWRDPATDKGKVGIEIGGKIEAWWPFKWHSVERTWSSTRDVDLLDPEYQPPQPISFKEPGTAGQTDWMYSTSMFQRIDWNPEQLAEAAGVDPSDLDSELRPITQSGPQMILDHAKVELGQADPGEPADSATSEVLSATVSTPASPTALELQSAWEAAGRDAGKLPAAVKDCIAPTTRSVQVEVPKWRPDDAGSKEAILMAQVNWQLYLASITEESSLTGLNTIDAKVRGFECGRDESHWDVYPSLEQWQNTNEIGVQFNLGYPQKPPNDVTQYCRDGADGAYGAACTANLKKLGQPWGTGWGEPPGSSAQQASVTR